MKYSILYRKKQFKKNKTWDSDGFLSVSADHWVLFDDGCNELAKTSPIDKTVQLDFVYKIFGLEFMV
jgi:hypothetical protein